MTKHHVTRAAPSRRISGAHRTSPDQTITRFFSALTRIAPHNAQTNTRSKDAKK